MRASEWWPTLPLGPTPDREEAIIQAVRDGHFLPIVWVPVEVVIGTLHALIGVSADALRIGEPGDAWRVPVTPLGAQRIADVLTTQHGIACTCPTAQIDDLAWAKATSRVPPHYMANTDAEVQIMGTTARSWEHSRWIDAQLAQIGHQEGMLVRNIGKAWILTPSLWKRSDGDAKGVNYGWHWPTQQPETSRAATAAGGYVKQNIGYAHNAAHVDYSQTLELVSEEVILTDSTNPVPTSTSLASIALDPALCALVNHDGPLALRHPGVPCPAGEGASAVSCPCPWTLPPKGRGTTAALVKQYLPAAIVGTAIGTAAALVATRKA